MQPLPVDIASLMEPRVQKVTIASVYPHELSAIKYHTGIVQGKDGKPVRAAMMKYVLPAASRTKPSTVTIYDTYQMTPDYEWEGDTPPPQVARGVRAVDIAAQLIKEWAEDSAVQSVMGVGGLTIGIGIVAGDAPTEAELDHLQAKQNAYDAAIVAEADGLYVGGPEAMKRISKRHRRALEHLGDFDSERHPWYINVAKGPMKACRACSQMIASQALRCKYCNVELDKFCFEREIEPTDDPVVLASVKFMKARAKKTA